MKKWRKLAVASVATIFLMTGCQPTTTVEKKVEQFECAKYERETPPQKEQALQNPVKMSESAQAKYDSVYQIFVGSFNDTNQDGIGDIRGITEKLDYIQSLGFKAIWLTPVHPSTTYHKYDVSDYRGIDPQFGTLADYEELIREAHKRDMRIVQDLVINHVSVEHEWFKDVKAKGKASEYCSYFVIKQNGEQYTSDADQWYTLNDDLKYYASFWKGMPELRLGNPAVQKAIDENIAFWQQKGVDGFRLDAAGVFFNNGEYPKKYGANQYDAVDVVKTLHAQALKRNSETYFVTEAWDNSDFVAPFYAAADSSFNFDLAKATLDSVRGTLAKDYQKAYTGSKDAYTKVYENYLDATFLSNHDQDRVATRLPSLEEQKLAASILLTTPGTPYVYYGEEIGMKGNKPDEYIREPMKWNDTQFTNQTIWKNGLRYNSDVASLEKQQQDPNSLYQHYKKMLAIRAQMGDIRKARLNFLELDPTVLAYTVNDKLVIHNLSGNEKTLTHEQIGKIQNVLLASGKVENTTLVIPARSTFIGTLKS